jgi:hypothetical protein
LAGKYNLVGGFASPLIAFDNTGSITPLVRKKLKKKKKFNMFKKCLFIGGKTT